MAEPLSLFVREDSTEPASASDWNSCAGVDERRKNEFVMVGAHLDSWAAATGATDDGAGVVIAMEAMRILNALGVQPKRTIRIALWTGVRARGSG
jgi:carboxypeptidase Q